MFKNTITTEAIKNENQRIKKHHQERRRNAEQEHAREIKQAQAECARHDYLDGLERGDKVKYSVLVYAGTETPAKVQTLYFVSRFSDTGVLLADTKQQAMTGRGNIYSVHGIII